MTAQEQKIELSVLNVVVEESKKYSKLRSRDPDEPLPVLLLHVCLPFRDKNIQVLGLEGLDIQVKYQVNKNKFVIGCLLKLSTLKSSKTDISEWKQRLWNKLASAENSCSIQRDLKDGSFFVNTITDSPHTTMSMLDYLILEYIPKPDRTQLLHIMAELIFESEAYTSVLKATLQLLRERYPAHDMELRYTKDCSVKYDPAKIFSIRSQNVGWCITDDTCFSPKLGEWTTINR